MVAGQVIGAGGRVGGEPAAVERDPQPHAVVDQQPRHAAADADAGRHRAHARGLHVVEHKGHRRHHTHVVDNEPGDRERHQHPHLRLPAGREVAGVDVQGGRLNRRQNRAGGEGAGAVDFVGHPARERDHRERRPPAVGDDLAVVVLGKAPLLGVEQRRELAQADPEGHLRQGDRVDQPVLALAEDVLEERDEPAQRRPSQAAADGKARRGRGLVDRLRPRRRRRGKIIGGAVAGRRRGRRRRQFPHEQQVAGGRRHAHERAGPVDQHLAGQGEAAQLEGLVELADHHAEEEQDADVADDLRHRVAAPALLGRHDLVGQRLLRRVDVAQHLVEAQQHHQHPQLPDERNRHQQQHRDAEAKHQERPAPADARPNAVARVVARGAHEHVEQDVEAADQRDQQRQFDELAQRERQRRTRELLEVDRRQPRRLDHHHPRPRRPPLLGEDRKQPASCFRVRPRVLAHAGECARPPAKRQMSPVRYLT